MPSQTVEGPLEHTVALPLGQVVVRLDRRGLALEARGGFEARWADADTQAALSSDAYREVVKTHLRAVYVTANGRDPSAIPLNLASHQLVDDLIGWSKLNRRR